MKTMAFAVGAANVPFYRQQLLCMEKESAVFPPNNTK